MVRATVQHKDGTMLVVESLPGQALDLQIPSGGFWAADGPGAGALECLPWSHAVCKGDVRSIVFFVDHGASLDQQAHQMATAVKYLESLGPCPKPAMLPTLKKDINWETTEQDMPDGIMISVNFYHKLVMQGKGKHQAGLTNEQMKSIADRFAGAPPPPPPPPPRPLTPRHNTGDSGVTTHHHSQVRVEVRPARLRVRQGRTRPACRAIHSCSAASGRALQVLPARPLHRPLHPAARSSLRPPSLASYYVTM